MNILKIILLTLFTYILFIDNITNAAINFAVSPIKYELEVFTGTTITQTATLRNNSSKSVNILTTKTDFQANGEGGKPDFVRYSELVHPDQQLSSWININIDSFIINPNEEKDISFNITIPVDATPGGHYGAVCFKNNNSETTSSGDIGINVDYCTLILINVDGEVITEAEVNETIIKKGSSGKGWGTGLSSIKKDECSIIDLTPSNYDGKCINNIFENDDDIKENINQLNLDNESNIELSDFNINFDTLFINEGNTHLVPKGTITLIDEDGNTIKGIGKETIRDEYGVKKGIKIVDYLPINDELGNVLPSQKRNFGNEWRGFPYEGYDEEGKIVIKYWSPEEYYTKQNTLENGYIMPWERINERINHEKVQANINIAYVNNEGEDVEFNSAKDFYIDYKEKYVSINPYSFICLFFILIILFLLWIIFRKKKLICINKKCKKKLDKDMKICPYCGTKQKKNKK